MDAVLVMLMPSMMALLSFVGVPLVEYDYEGDFHYNHAEFVNASNLIENGIDGSGVAMCYVDIDHPHDNHPFLCNEENECKYNYSRRGSSTHGLNVMSIGSGYSHITPDGIFATGVAPRSSIVQNHNNSGCQVQNVSMASSKYQWDLYLDEVWRIGSAGNDNRSALFNVNPTVNNISVGGVNWDNESNIPTFWRRTSHDTTHEIMKPDIVSPAVEQCGASSQADDYTCWYGTSQSSPHVAGAMALYKQAYPERSFSQARSAFMLTADPVWHKEDGRQALPSEVGSGYLNVGDAVDTDFIMSTIHGSQYRTHSPRSGGDPSSLNYPSIKSDCLQGTECMFRRSFQNMSKELVTVSWWDDLGKHHEVWSVGHEGELSFRFKMNDTSFDRREGYIPIRIDHNQSNKGYTLTMPYIIQPVTNTVRIPEMTGSLHTANQWVMPYGTISISGDVSIEEDLEVVLKQGITVEGDTSEGSLPHIIMSSVHPFYVRETNRYEPITLRNLFLDMRNEDAPRYRIKVEYGGLEMENVAMSYWDEALHAMRHSSLTISNTIFVDRNDRDFKAVSISLTDATLTDFAVFGEKPIVMTVDGHGVPVVLSENGSIDSDEIVLPNGDTYSVGSESPVMVATTISNPVSSTAPFHGSEPTSVSTLEISSINQSNTSFAFYLVVCLMIATTVHQTMSRKRTN